MLIKIYIKLPVINDFLLIDFLMFFFNKYFSITLITSRRFVRLAEVTAI